MKFDFWKEGGVGGRNQKSWKRLEWRDRDDTWWKE